MGGITGKDDRRIYKIWEKQLRKAVKKAKSFLIQKVIRKIKRIKKRDKQDNIQEIILTLENDMKEMRVSSFNMKGVYKDELRIHPFRDLSLNVFQKLS
jgi:hypothetical protein